MPLLARLHTGGRSTALLRSSNVSSARNPRRRSHLSALARVQVQDGSLYCSGRDACAHPHVQAVLRVLSLLLRIARLQDVDFLFERYENVCHRTQRRKGSPPVAVLSFDADHERRPMCENILVTPRALAELPDGARWLARADGYHANWRARRNLVLWRGAATGAAPLFNSSTNEPRTPRALAVALSKRRPDLLDAQFAGRGSLSFLSNDREVARRMGYGDGPTGHLTWEEQQQRYRATLVLDGNTVADRLPFLLFTMTAIIKQESPLREAWYDLLRPYVHYIPVRHDLADLEGQIEWALANASRLQQIARNAAQLAMRHLSRRGQLCHWLAVMRKLASHTEPRIEVDPHAERVQLGPSVWSGTVTHFPLIGTLRPQLAHIPFRPSDLRALLRLYPTPCVGGLTRAHECVDL